jgi:hypothetical protein
VSSRQKHVGEEYKTEFIFLKKKENPILELTGMFYILSLFNLAAGDKNKIEHILTH